MIELEDIEKDLAGELGGDGGFVFSPEETERRNDGRRYLVYKPPREPGQPQVIFVLPEKDPEPQ